MLGAALAHPTIFVRDLDRARVFYENLGLTVSADMGAYRAAWLKDPDGNWQGQASRRRSHG